MANRRLRVALNEEVSARVTCWWGGVLQGSIFGHSCFLLWINYLPVLICVLLLSMLRPLSGRAGFWAWIWSARHCWLDEELSCLLISVLYKLNSVSFDFSNHTGVTNMKVDGSIDDEKLSFKMLGLFLSSKLDWSSYNVSLAKTVSKKIGAFIHARKLLFSEIAFYLYKVAIW